MGQHDSSHHEKKTPFSVFVALVVFVFFCTLSAADSIGFVPYYIDGSTPSSLTTGSTESPRAKATQRTPEQSAPIIANAAIPSQTTASGVRPTRITISAIDLDLPVQNPLSRDIATLDAILTSGPVRYVDSAMLGGRGNVLIFAHTSHLPVVRNQMYRAFNDIPELIAGDEITLTGDNGRTYRYRVSSVRQVNADDAKVELSPEMSPKLTLVTCDTLSGKSARFVLEADFVGTN
ncbi:sortase [Candidatus Kaiserbacteria bacterium]|nr:sortase [Candidatus Kaiserbacteria bacterium]